MVNYSHFHAALFSWYLAVTEGQPYIWLDFLPFFVIMKSRLSSWRWLFIIKSSFWQRPCLPPPTGLRLALVCRREAAFWSGYFFLSPSAKPHLRHTTHCSERCSSLPARKPAPWTALPGPRTCDEYWLWVNWPCGFLYINQWFSSFWNSITRRMQIKCGWCLWRLDWRDWC